MRPIFIEEINQDDQSTQNNIEFELSPEAYVRVEKRFQEFMRELKPMSDAIESSQRLTPEDFTICINAT